MKRKPAITEQKNTTIMVFVDDLLPNPFEPLSRANMPEAEAHEGWLSLERSGLINKVLRVRAASAKGKYEVGDGWRRRCWCAYGYHQQRMDKYAYMSCEVGEYTDLQMADMIPEANSQRKDMNDIQWAEFYENYLEKFGGTQESLGEHFHKSQPEIANTMRLLSLPAKVQSLIISREIFSSHGRSLLVLDTAEEQLAFAEKVKNYGWSVADLDRKIKDYRAELVREAANQPLFIEVPPPAAPVEEGKPSAPDENTVKAERIAEEFYGPYFKRGESIKQVKDSHEDYSSPGDYRISTGGYLNGKKIPTDKAIVTIDGKEPVIIPLKQIYDKVIAGKPPVPAEQPHVEEEAVTEPGKDSSYIVCHFCEAGTQLKSDGSLPDGWEKQTYEQGAFYACPDHVDEAFCRVCGCSEFDPCPGGCWWVEEDLCSACASAAVIARLETKTPPASAPADPEVIIVDAEFFRIITRSNSVGQLGLGYSHKKQTIQEPFTYKNNTYICLGQSATGANGIEIELAYCHRVVFSSDFKGTKQQYPDWENPKGHYYGVVVYQGKDEYVITSPELTFQLDKSKTSAAPAATELKPCADVEKWLYLDQDTEGHVHVSYYCSKKKEARTVFPGNLNTILSVPSNVTPDVITDPLIKFIIKTNASWESAEPAVKSEVPIPEGVREAHLVPQDECIKCGLGPTDHTLGFKFPDGEGVERKVCIKDYRKWEKGQKGGRKEKASILPLPGNYSTKKIGIDWVAIDHKDAIIAIASNKKDVSDKAVQYINAAVLGRLSRIRDPKPGEYMLNHTYRVIPKEGCVTSGGDVVAQDINAAIAEFGLSPFQIKEIKVFKSSGKIGTDGGCGCGWGKCLELTPAAAGQKSEPGEVDHKFALNKEAAVMEICPDCIRRIGCDHSLIKIDIQTGGGSCEAKKSLTTGAAINKFTKSVRCYQCRETQHMEFEYKENPDRFSPKEHWMGVCPDCKQPNFIENAKWDKMLTESKETK